MVPGAGATAFGIWYYVSGTTVTVEWLVTRSGFPNDVYQFQIIYSTATPGVWTYRYYVAGNAGASASVGVQGSKSLT